MNKSVANILTKEFLQSVHKKLEVKEIAKLKNVSDSAVRKYLYKFDLSLKESRIGKNTGVNNPSWKGGRYRKPNGYIMVQVDDKSYKREHIVNIEKHIKRELKIGEEVVHHINGVRDDNRIENLILMFKREHDRYHLILRNKSIKCETQTLCDMIELLYPNKYNELKMYAELTRILKCKK